LAEAGGEIVAVAGTSELTSLQAATRLRQFCRALPYPAESVRAMLDRCALDAVAICSPAEKHFEHLACALDANLHVFCEKPFIWAGGAPVVAQAEAMLARFASKRLVVHLNTQWIYTLSGFAALHGTEPRVESFRMLLSPPRPGIDILVEAAPHPISMLVALGATGEVRDVEAYWSQSLEELDLSFKAMTEHRSGIDAACSFRTATRQPRRAFYAINQRFVERRVDMEGYEISLRSPECSIAVVDPLRLSAEHFLARIALSDYQTQTKPIIANILMLDQLSTALQTNTSGEDDFRNP
jgi:hypothetical protein